MNELERQRRGAATAIARAEARYERALRHPRGAGDELARLYRKQRRAAVPSADGRDTDHRAEGIAE